jgi:hypothetical protein
VKSGFLLVCLPLSGVVGCVGAETDIGDGPHNDNDGVSDNDDPNAEVFTSRDGGVQVGDLIDGELVADVYTDNDDCTTIELQGAPAFECSEAQLASLESLASRAQEPPETAPNANLATHTCEELADRSRPFLQQTAIAKLERQYVEQLAEFCLPPVREVHLIDGEEVDECPGYGSVDAGAVYDPPQDEASEYSTTNTQVAGVDEADYVKNDGDTIYVLNGQALVVLDAWPVEEMAEIARVELPAPPRRMFLSEDRLVVYLRVGGEETETCTYGYDCRSSSDSGSTLVQVYDVSEPALPVLLKEYEFSGSYLASRRIGDRVFSVVHDRGPAIPSDADVNVGGNTPDNLEKQYTQKKAALTALIDNLPAEYFLPWIIEQTPGEAATTTAACDTALAASAARGTSFVSVVGFDLATLAAPSSTLIASKPGFVYASPASLYLAVDGVDGQDDTFSSPWGTNAQDDQTTIHKFGLDGIDAKYHGSQAIQGHVLNQFSMDEHEDVLRVATSTGWVPDPAVSSNILTLGEQGGEFEVLGKLSGLAPTEDIRSVRFDAGRGFVVTFKKTDPLFVIGLSNPAEPVVLGELKIPGFSTYMHLLDDTHLLAVGFDADDQGDFAYFDGIQIQIFDVSDLDDPKLQHKAVIGTRGSGSEALLDHLAFNYFPSRNVLALPATICQGGDDGQYGDQFEFAGLVVFDVSLLDGLSERGRLPFATPDDVPSGESLDCGQWWTDASSLVKRSIFTEDYAIGLSDDWVKAAALSDLATVLSSVPLNE